MPLYIGRNHSNGTKIHAGQYVKDRLIWNLWRLACADSTWGGTTEDFASQTIELKEYEANLHVLHQTIESMFDGQYKAQHDVLVGSTLRVWRDNTFTFITSYYFVIPGSSDMRGS